MYISVFTKSSAVAERLRDAVIENLNFGNLLKIMRNYDVEQLRRWARRVCKFLLATRHLGTSVLHHFQWSSGLRDTTDFHVLAVIEMFTDTGRLSSEAGKATAAAAVAYINKWHIDHSLLSIILPMIHLSHRRKMLLHTCLFVTCVTRYILMSTYLHVISKTT